MITAIIISVIFFISSLAAMIGAILFDKDSIFITGLTTMFISTIAMVSLVLYRNAEIKQNSPKEYPVSDYTFKIKVVEFEEQRDTILVVIPKEE